MEMPKSLSFYSFLLKTIQVSLHTSNFHLIQ